MRQTSILAFMASGLVSGVLGEASVHVCVDMQRLFSDGGPWATPWMARVLPVISTLAERYRHQTIFTRFIPPERAEDMPGQWQRYYERWADVTRERLDQSLLELVPPLDGMAVPAQVVDKPVYSPFLGKKLPRLLQQRSVDTLVVTGSETDVCVLATVLGAVDFGYRVVLVTDAVCSSSDAGHDALLTLFSQRFSEQIILATAEEVSKLWIPD